jgi:hypothetical protein
MNSMARRMFELVEPIGLLPYSADEPNEIYREVHATLPGLGSTDRGRDAARRCSSSDCASRTGWHIEWTRLQYYAICPSSMAIANEVG